MTVVYFDESYDHKHQRLILWACFFVHPEYIYRRFLELKDKYRLFNDDGHYKELKYKHCYQPQLYSLAHDTCDLFFASESCYFRAIVIETWAKWFDKNYFWPDTVVSPAMRNAIIYKKFTQLLFSHMSKELQKAHLYLDQLCHMRTDRFIELMQILFVSNSSKFASIQEVDSRDDEHQLMQITDLFLWCILNQLAWSKCSRKKRIASYLRMHAQDADEKYGSAQRFHVRFRKPSSFFR